MDVEKHKRANRNLTTKRRKATLAICSIPTKFEFTIPSKKFSLCFPIFCHWISCKYVQNRQWTWKNINIYRTLETLQQSVEKQRLPSAEIPPNLICLVQINFFTWNDFFLMNNRKEALLKRNRTMETWQQTIQMSRLLSA